MSVPRATVEQRKGMPLASGVLDYFPDALLVVAEVSRIGNEQHHPGEPLHWDKSKSTDEADALLRHLLDRGTLDTDGLRHSAKVAWRALALLQRELDAEAAPVPERRDLELNAEAARIDAVLRMRDDPWDRIPWLILPPAFHVDDSPVHGPTVTYRGMELGTWSDYGSRPHG